MQRLPTNRLFAGYLLLAAPALLFPHRSADWAVLLVLHVLTAAVALGVGPSARLGRYWFNRLPQAARWLADWYPVALVPLLYLELAVLNVAVWNGAYFDDFIQRVEFSLFGGQPSRELAVRWPSVTVSEFLHGAYLSYYFIIYVPLIALYARASKAEFRETVFTVMLAFFVHYLFFIYFPVQGPRYLFPAPSGALADGVAYALAHQVLEAGSSRGAAFPSSHVGVSVAMTWMTFRFLPRLAPVVAILTMGLAIGAVYGGFHYATDVIAGLVLGLICAAAAPVLRGWLSREVRTRHGP